MSNPPVMFVLMDFNTLKMIKYTFVMDATVSRMLLVTGSRKLRNK
jgi:hypothetical protein